MSIIREFHLFAGIGGGIYGGELLGHKCCGAVEIDDFCNKILKLRQEDGWMNEFDLFGDITKLNGKDYIGNFEILCGGFPCQAFSHAAHGKNIAEKNLWPEMFRFVKESKAPVVFAENVTFKALDKAREDLISIGYDVQLCKLSCSEIGADHRRDRFWLLAVNDYKVFKKVTDHIATLPKLTTKCWEKPPFDNKYNEKNNERRKQLKGIGNAQSPFVVASVFRILCNRFLNSCNNDNSVATKDEINNVITINDTWLRKKYGQENGFVHTPTTMANYSCPSMMKHKGCRNYNHIFGKPTPKDAEYLMGFPIGASIPVNIGKENFESWIKNS